MTTTDADMDWRSAVSGLHIFLPNADMEHRCVSLVGRAKNVDGHVLRVYMVFMVSASHELHYAGE